jgi:AraC-like DNA-binding protein
MRLNRVPHARLRPFVKTVWLTDETPDGRPAASGREHVLPTGDMHLVFRLSENPVRLFTGPGDMAGESFGLSVAGGARGTFYVKDVISPASAIGAELLPGAADLLFGTPSGELAGRHFRLDDLWGRRAVSAREQLLEERNPERRLDLLESLLASRLPTVRGLHPAVALALERFTLTASVRHVVAESGYSHRRFVALFREAVGLSPKLYCRVRRFQNALTRVAAGSTSGWADFAITAGYSDQPHFNREFLEFAGVTPGEYRRRAPDRPYHIGVR